MFRFNRSGTESSIQTEGKEVKMRRSHMSRKSSKRNFRKGFKTHKKNVAPPPMRGGIRL